MLVGWGASGPDRRLGTIPPAGPAWRRWPATRPQQAGERPRAEAARPALAQPPPGARPPAPPQLWCPGAGSPQGAGPAPSYSRRLRAQPDGGRQGPAGLPAAAHSHRAAAAGRGPLRLGAHDRRTRGRGQASVVPGGHALTGRETLKSRCTGSVSRLKRKPPPPPPEGPLPIWPPRVRRASGAGPRRRKSPGAWPRTRIWAGLSARGAGAAGSGERRKTPARERRELEPAPLSCLRAAFPVPLHRWVLHLGRH